MRLLEEQARKIAEEAERDKPKPSKMTFVKYIRELFYTVHDTTGYIHTWALEAS